MLDSRQINEKYENIIAACRDIFCGKGMEYGPTWAAFRWGSLCDQLWIKAKRIRQLEEKEGKIPDSVEGEYMALINYAIIFLMRLQNPGLNSGSDTLLEDISRIGGMGDSALRAAYDDAAGQAFKLYLLKNHDYNNAWQEMAVPSITDMIIIKILRMKHIVASVPRLTLADVDGQLYDIINYSVFALVMLERASQGG